MTPGCSLEADPKQITFLGHAELSPFPVQPIEAQRVLSTLYITLSAPMQHLLLLPTHSLV